MNFTLILLRDATQMNGPYKPRTSRTGQRILYTWPYYTPSKGPLNCPKR